MSPHDEISSKSINAVSTLPFSQMSIAGKACHIGQVIVFFATAGFAYPTIFSD